MRRNFKWLFMLAAILLFLFCGEFLPEEPLRSKAMVVGFGIDYTDKNTLLIHLQILTGSGNKSETGSNTRVLSAEGSTLGEAAYKISRETGLAVSLTHCNVVILGESLLKSQATYAALNYLVSNAYLSDNACLLSCQGSAGDILSSPIGFGGNASIYIREIVGMYDSFGDITGKTVRQFVVDYHRLGQANWLPFISRKEIPPEIPSSSASETSSDKKYLFSMNKVAILVKNELVGIWGENGAMGINFLVEKISKAQLLSKGENGENIDWYVLKNDCKLKYDPKKKTVSADLKLKAVVKEIIDFSDNNAHVDRLSVTAEEVNRCENALIERITAFFKETQEKNADVFGFLEGFYNHCKISKDELPLSKIKLELTVKIEQT